MSDNLIEEVLELPADLRLKMVERLIESLNLPSNKEIDDYWAEEAERRVKEIEEGKVTCIPAEIVYKELEKLLKD